MEELTSHYFSLPTKCCHGKKSISGAAADQNDPMRHCQKNDGVRF